MRIGGKDLKSTWALSRISSIELRVSVEELEQMKSKYMQHTISRTNSSPIESRIYINFGGDTHLNEATNLDELKK